MTSLPLQTYTLASDVMIKELQYKGYATEPSDYECPDGQLATSLNLINEDEQLKPVFQPAVIATLPEGYKVVHIHEGSSFTHYIIRDQNNILYWSSAEEVNNNATITTENLNTKILHDFQTADIISINTVGNTIVVLATDAMHYILWKNDNDEYLYLGTHLPEIPITFGLKAKFKRGPVEEFSLPAGGEKHTTIEKDENRAAVTQKFLAMANKFISEMATGKGMFLYPFLVRYALRLYDGTTTMASPPVLMPCATACTPVICAINAANNGENVNGKKVQAYGACHTLDYLVRLTAQQINNIITQWGDIVKSIDIFITPPIYTYNQAGEIKTLALDLEGANTNTIAFHWNQNVNITYEGDRQYPAQKYHQHYYQSYNYGTLFKHTHWRNEDNDNGVTGNYDSDADNYAERVNNDGVPVAVTNGEYVTRTMPRSYKLPAFTPEAIKEKIRTAGNFYLLASIKLENIVEAINIRKNIEVADDYLLALTQREQLTDDYDSHDTILPKQAFVYNNRLNIADIRKQVFTGFDPQVALPYTNGWQDIQLSFNSQGNVSNYTYDDYTRLETMRIYSFIRQEGKDFLTRTETNEIARKTPVYFYYNPNPNAYRIVIDYNPIGSSEPDRHVIELERHDFLNGAFALDIEMFLRGYSFRRYPSFEDNNRITELNTLLNNPEHDEEYRTVTLRSKIYTSEVNNPFHFPLLGINTIGTGKILGMSSAAKALSQGQFGQFPLYAFTTEGIWALEVSKGSSNMDGLTFNESAAGLYSARQPITRDVCINPDSITQLDSSVLFATDRGIMQISGSHTECITDSIFSEAPFNILDLPGIEQLHAKLGHAADACLPMQPFLGFLAGCQMVYDYVHQRIFVYNPTKVNGIPKYTYAYVFSLKSKMWGMVFTNLDSTINAYPEALAMTLDNKLVSFSDTDEEVCKGLYITRPLKLEAADVHKTISALIQRGHFQRGDVGTVLYGSRDLYTWHLIWSSKDHYLRGFRGTPYKYFRIAGLATLTDGKSIFGASVNFEPRHTNQLR